MPLEKVRHDEADREWWMSRVSPLPAFETHTREEPASPAVAKEVDVTNVTHVTHGTCAHPGYRPARRHSAHTGACGWHHCSVSEPTQNSTPARVETDWLSVPDVADAIGETPSRVRQLVGERYLVAIRKDGVVRIPAVFLLDGEPVVSLRGTVIVLSDAGFDDAEIVDWLLEHEESVGSAPIEALRAGRKTIVRRVAQALA